MPSNRPFKRSKDTAPAWVSLKIRDAGSSAFAWGESELLSIIDPAGKLQQLTTAINTAAILAASSILIALGFSINTASGLLTVVAVAAGLIHHHARDWSPLTLTAALIALWPLGSGALGMVSLGLLAGIGVLAYLQSPQSRIVVFVAVAGSLLVSGSGLPGMVPAVLAAGLLWGLLAAGIIRPKVGNDLPFQRPGPPPSTIPWLIRVIKRREIRNAPNEIRRKTLGAAGERSTALRLLGLQGQSRFGVRMRAKSVAVHDIASLDAGKTRANLDHLVLTSGGLFVLDTKVFASGSSVSVVAENGDVVVAQDGQPKSILPLIVALARECIATRDALSHEAVGFLVIHGARVPRGISVLFEREGVTVEVIDQKDLIGRLDPPRRGGMPSREYAALSRAIRNIPSASGGRSVPVRPLRLTFANRPRITAPANPALTLPALEQSKAGSGATDTVRLPDAIQSDWDSMLATPPAPLDLVEEDMRGMRRGQGFEVFAITQDLSSYRLYAMSGPSQGADGGLFVWATDGANWEAFQETNRPVALTRVPVGHIIITADTNN